MTRSPTPKPRNGEPKRAGGRPSIPKGKRKGEWVRMRVTTEEKEILMAAAKREHLEMSTWLRQLALLAAEAATEKKKT